MHRRLLFLCTGNYYRSRFAEHLFNDLSRAAKLDWLAESRGLRIGWPGNIGPISAHTRRGLDVRGIPLADDQRMPLLLKESDLRSADRIIAVKGSEHRPMMAEHFAEWTDRIEYWEVHDLDLAGPEEALEELESRVRWLIDELRAA